MRKRDTVTSAGGWSQASYGAGSETGRIGSDFALKQSGQKNHVSFGTQGPICALPVFGRSFHGNH